MIAQPTYMSNLATVGYAPSVSAPDGYMTGDEFESRLKNRIKKFYTENGLLQSNSRR